MRVLTGSVLALLVGGVAYMNLTTPPPGEQVGQGAAVPDGATPSQPADTVGGAGKAQPAAIAADNTLTPAEGESGDDGGDGGIAIVPLRTGSGDEQAALDRIALDGPGLERSAPKLADFDPIRDRARSSADESAPEAGSDTTASEGEAVLEDLLGVGRPRNAEPVAATGEPVAAAPGTVAVRVTDTGSAPLAGITVAVVEQGEASPLVTGATDADGRVQLAGLEPGLYQLQVPSAGLPDGWLAPWYADLCRGAATPAGIGTPCFVVLADGSSQAQELALVRAGRVQGEVFGRDGAPASDALVRVVYDAPGYESCRAITQTDTSGNYSFELVPGKYRMEVAFRSDGPNGGVPPFEPRALVVLEGERTRMAPLRAPVIVAAVTETAAPEAKPEVAPSAPSLEASRPIERTAERTAANREAPRKAPASSAGAMVELELFGRVVSNFGEPLRDVEVLLQEAASQELRASARTDSNGEWKVSGVTGKSLVAIARGERLLASSQPVAVAAQEGQRRVRVQDFVVEVRRVFQLRGRIEIAQAELVSFRDELLARVGESVELTDEHVRRAYVRGLRLEQRAVGARHGRTVAILDDGTFSWSCALPADDVEFVLESRGMRTGGRAARTRVVVTPAGDRTLEVQMPFPSEANHGSAATDDVPRS